MSEGFNYIEVAIPLYGGASDWQGDDVHMHVYRAPDADEGGAVRVISAWAVNAAATSAGTTFEIAIHNYGTGGTAVEGTVAAAIGGTAAPWAADTPKEFTITAAQAKIDAGEWLVLDKQETNSSDPTRMMVYILLEPGV
jgi:hypothetical protein